MIQKLSRFLIFTGFILLIGIFQAYAGKISQGFLDELTLSDADSFHKAIVAMSDRVNVRSLEESMVKPRRLSREVRHYRIVTALKTQAERTQTALLDELAALKGKGEVAEYRSHWVANFIYVKAKPQVILDIMERNDVDVVFEDIPIELVKPVEMEPAMVAGADGAEQGLKDIKANVLWAKGYTGKGVLVSHLDTGVDGNHVALASRWRGLLPGVTPAESFFDPVTSRTFPFDSGSHGTHTMGTICGRATNDTIGVAPDATWITAAVIDRVSIPRTVSDALLAFEWTADPDGDPQTVDDVPVVSSNSWGLSPLFHGYAKCDPTFWEVLDGCEAAGVAVVFAAGNEGSYGAESLRTPADRITLETNVFSVGALKPGSQTIASFSSLGPSGCDHQTKKPEVCAQGENVRSSVPGNSYASYSGTSMATPHIAGAIALLMQVDPNQTSAQVKELLYTTADDLGPTGNDNTYGYGRINLETAYEVLTTSFGHVQGRVTDSNSGQPIAALIEIVGTSKKTTCNANGEYTISLAGDTTYTFRASYFGYVTSEKQKFVPIEQTVTLNFQLDPADAGSLGGCVRDSEGFPVNGALVTVQGTPYPPEETNFRGNYLFDVVPGGNTYNVLAERCGLLSKTQSVYINAGQFNRKDFALESLKPDNMENGENGFEHYAVSSGYVDEWHMSTYRNHTTGGTTSWKCGGKNGNHYSDLSDGGLVVHCMNLMSGSTMKFWHWMDAEIYSSTEAWDGGIVEISTDGGATFTQITPTGGYPYTIYSNPASPFEPGTPCYSGTYTAWDQETFNLSSYSGEVYIRFRFGTDGYVTQEGWYIDDLTIEVPSPKVDISVSETPATITPGSTAQWKVTLKNNLSQKTTVDVWLIVVSSALPSELNPYITVLKSKLNLPANYTASKYVAVTVPLSAPAGTYKIRNVVGTYPDDIVDYAQFTTQVVGGDRGGSSGDLSFEAHLSD